MKHFCLAVVFLTIFAIAGFGQDKSDDVALPDEVMGQVVRTVVQATIKPPKEQQLFYFANDGVRTEWLPDIENVTYVLLDKNEKHWYNREVYFFTQLEKKDKKYQITFAFGDPGCSAHGETWTFSVADSQVKDLKREWGWGSAC